MTAPPARTPKPAEAPESAALPTMPIDDRPADIRAREFAGAPVRLEVATPLLSTFSTGDGRVVHVWRGGPVKLAGVEPGPVFRSGPPLPRTRQGPSNGK